MKTGRITGSQALPGLRQFLSCCVLLGFVRGRRSLKVASTCVQRIRDTVTQKLRLKSSQSPIPRCRNRNHDLNQNDTVRSRKASDRLIAIKCGPCQRRTSGRLCNHRAKGNNCPPTYLHAARLSWEAMIWHTRNRIFRSTSLPNPPRCSSHQRLPTGAICRR